MFVEPEVSSSVLPCSSRERGSVNAGDRVGSVSVGDLIGCVAGLSTAAAINGESDGSPASVDTPDVSTLRTGSSVVTLGKRRVRSSASSLLCSMLIECRSYARSSTCAA